MRNGVKNVSIYVRNLTRRLGGLLDGLEDILESHRPQKWTNESKMTQPIVRVDKDSETVDQCSEKLNSHKANLDASSQRRRSQLMQALADLATQ